MKLNDNQSLLRTLDFNGDHSGDVLAAAIFRQSAQAIRRLEVELFRARQGAFETRRINNELKFGLDRVTAERDRLYCPAARPMVDGDLYAHQPQEVSR